MAALIELDKNIVHNITPLTVIGGGNCANLHIDSSEENAARIIFDKAQFRAESLSDKCICTINGKRLKKSGLSEGDELVVDKSTFRFTFFPPSLMADREDISNTAILDALFELSKKLLDEPDVEPLTRLLDALLSATGADKGFLAVRNDGEFSVASMRNVDGSSRNECDEISQELVKQVVEKRKALLFSDAPEDTSLGVSKSLMGLNLRSILVVPIIKEGVVKAVLYAGSGRAAAMFDESDLKSATIFAAQASLLLDHVEKTRVLIEENRTLKQIAGTAIIYQSEIMETLLRQTIRLSASSLPILVTGETGTGKELLARMIHERSSRANAPFVIVNCAAIPENLVESELFGHKKGAFTGAISDTAGRIGAASGGTLFLDEIGELPLTQQAKLLRVLESGEYESVGDPHPKKADVRIVAATNRDLTKSDFRQDLYYRLSAAVLNLPPLRDRGLDIILIAKALLKASPEGIARKMRFSKDAEAAMLSHAWPGNIRELKHRVMRAAVLSESTEISASDLELEKGEESAIQPLLEAKERFAQDYIKRILALHQGNKSAAARVLGIDPRTIYRYMDEKEGES